MRKLLLFSFLLFAFTVNSQSNLWKEVPKFHLKSKSKQVRPSKYKVYRLDLQLLKEELEKAPERRENINLSTVFLSFPDENGMLKEYKISEASVMDRELQENHPTIKSYIGKSVDNSNSIIRFSISPYSGFDGIILNSAIPPTLIKRDGNYYQIFSEKNSPAEENPFKCGMVDKVEYGNKKSSLKKKTLINGQLRTYRLALATTGEYSQHILNSLSIPNTASDEDRKIVIIGHLNSVITSVNAVFERDLAATMQLVTNNKDILFLDGTTDNLDNNPSGLDKNQEVCDNIIGSSNYDIGHLLVTEDFGDVYGRAMLAGSCSISSKAKGISNISNHSNIVILHEMGHQFGAGHTFYELNNKEGIEVDKGLTIMSYGAGAEHFFHSVSIAKMRNFIQNSANCGSITSTGNTPPIADAGRDYIIPKSTPFLLEGTATDPDGSNLTYTWEQVDSEEGLFPLTSLVPQGPIFRWLSPINEPKRYIPNINTVLNGATENALESVPAVYRELNFTFLVRDNDARGGESSEDQMTVTVDDIYGPFLVTSDNNPVTWYSGTTRTVSWDVKNTNRGSVNTPTVDILFSTDGGITYPTTLAYDVANDGSYSFEVPSSIATTQGRFMIKGHDNIFLDVNNADITVEEKKFLVGISDAEEEKNLCSASSNSISYDFTYNSYLGFTGTVNFSATNLDGTLITFSPASTNINGTNITMTINNISEVNIGTNIISVTATSGSISSSNQVILKVYDNSTLNTVSLTNPPNGVTNLSDDFTFQWNAENGAGSYIIEISTDNSFSNIVDNATVTSNSFVSTSLNYNTIYYWHVRAINFCVNGMFSNISSFTTPLSANANDTYIPDNVFEQVLINLGYDAGPLDDYVPTRNIKNIPHLTIENLGIRDMTGIEGFTALTLLDFSGNQLSTLDLSKNTTLELLDVSSNELSALDLSKNTALTKLYVYGNRLLTLDLSKNTTLELLDVSSNKLSTLDLSKNTTLDSLNVSTNPLGTLNVSKNTALNILNCSFNELSTLDVSKNTSLTKLVSIFNNLDNLDFSKNTALSNLSLSYNSRLDSLDVSKNTALRALNCFRCGLNGLNVKNGNNNLFTIFITTENPDLKCIQVDNVAYSTSNWHDIDSHSIFSSEDCNSLSNKDFQTTNISISPNPVTNILYIESANNIKIEQVKIFNTLGKLIYDKRNKNNQIDFSNFSKAIYIIKLIDQEGRYTIKKILKE